MKTFMLAAVILTLNYLYKEGKITPEFWDYASNLVAAFATLLSVTSNLPSVRNYAGQTKQENGA